MTDNFYLVAVVKAANVATGLTIAAPTIVSQTAIPQPCVASTVRVETSSVA